MMMRGPLLLILLGAAVCQAEGSVNVGGRGFGDDYEWRSFEDGIKEADVRFLLSLLGGERVDH